MFAHYLVWKSEQENKKYFCIACLCLAIIGILVGKEVKKRSQHFILLLVTMERQCGKLLCHCLFCK